LGLAAGTGARERLDTRGPASCGHPRCREKATCVPDPGHYALPVGRQRSSTAPGCGPSSRGVRGSPAGRISEGKKRFCCVTTRLRNVWVRNGLERGPGSSTALLFRLGVATFSLGVLAMFGLAPGGLPATDLPLALRILAVALVPAPRHVLATTSFAQTGPLP
jgi:hypothetical protein